MKRKMRRKKRKSKKKKKSESIADGLFMTGATYKKHHKKSVAAPSKKMSLQYLLQYH